MVKAPSEAVRPSLNVTIQEKTNKNSLSHHGETASSSSTCKATTRVRIDPEKREEHVQDDKDEDEEEEDDAEAEEEVMNEGVHASEK